MKNQLLAIDTVVQYQKLLNTQTRVLIYMSTNWCTLCKPMLTEIRQAASELTDICFTVALIDGDLFPEILALFEINRVPALAYIKDGKCQHIALGALSKYEIIQHIRQYF